jgi:hypothetical protein
VLIFVVLAPENVRIMITITARNAPKRAANVKKHAATIKHAILIERDRKPPGYAVALFHYYGD